MKISPWGWGHCHSRVLLAISPPFPGLGGGGHFDWNGAQNGMGQAQMALPNTWEGILSLDKIVLLKRESHLPFLNSISTLSGNEVI